MAEKYDWLKEKAKDLLRDLQWAEKDATYEDEYDKLVMIAEEILEGIPITLLQKDYYTRWGLVSRLPAPLRRDTKYINKLMEHLYSGDVICFDEYLTAVIDDNIDDFEAKYGLQKQTKD